MRRLVLSKRVLVGLVLFTLGLAILYLYQTQGQGPTTVLLDHWISQERAGTNENSDVRETPLPKGVERKDRLEHVSADQKNDVCLLPKPAQTDIDTSEVLSTLNFEAPWIPIREFWSEFMEKRYLTTRRTVWYKKPLEVIIMPHSHNDPGWLKTLEGYYNNDTKDILNNAVDKLTQYRNMTFVWTEIQFLAMWWSEANAKRRQNLKNLISEGRFEILTGGWVMTDEANVNLFAMVDQMVEGHSWLKATLGEASIPRSSWSVDPFGHGGTFPYVLKASGIDNMVIMRIHYAWKEYFAKQRSGDFLWTQRWHGSSDESNGQILCHNFPYDIYSVKGSCGPKADVCLQFNFAAKAVQQPYNEYAMATRPITPANVKERAELLLESYGRTGSLHEHNVVLVPLGDDFTYAKGIEWDAQYSNYKSIIDYINSNPEYNAHVRFGTLSDYFDLARKRTTQFPTLNGDFYVYSDIFSSGYPAYWSGYFTTRPYMKQLSRHVEASLRSAEILFSLTYPKHKEELVSDYPTKLAVARQHLALFQHHDAITGTAKEHVMYDYGKKMFEGWKRTQSLQRKCLELLMGVPKGSLESDIIRDNYQDLPFPLPLDVGSGSSVVVVFNSLANDVIEAVTFNVDDPRMVHDLCIVDTQRPQDTIAHQVSVSPTAPHQSIKGWQVVFMAHLPALSVKTFRVYLCSDEPDRSNAPRKKTQVYCLNSCSDLESQSQKFMSVNQLPAQVAQLESHRYLLTFDPETWRLSKVKDKLSGTEHSLKVTLSAYPTQTHSSGAYLFAIDEYRDESFLDPQDDITQVIIQSGSIYTELQVHYSGGSGTPRATLVHTVRIYHAPRSSLSRGIYVENYFDYGDVGNFRDTDVYMRITTANIANNGVFYTDQNGFQMQRRKSMPDLGLRANIYPVTSTAYIEDEASRMSLLVDHAAAATSTGQGSLEVVMDRRAAFDDGRGLGEGVTDNQDTVHKYWLLFEDPPAPGDQVGKSEPYLSTASRLSVFLNRRLSYPSSTFHGKWDGNQKPAASTVQLLNRGLTCDTHLFNLRTASSESDHLKPGNSSLLMLHSQYSDYCASEKVVKGDAPSLESNLECDFSSNTQSDLNSESQPFKGMELVKVSRVTLTGNDRESDQKKSVLFKPSPMTIETFKVFLRPRP